MDNITLDLIPFAFIFIILVFLLAIPKKKVLKKSTENNQTVDNQIEPIPINKNNRELLEKAEIKLIALKDLYNQELIDASIYVTKTEVIAKNLSEEFGRNIMEFPEFQQKIIFNDLKKEISKKINTNNSKNVKNDIDNLISAVDNKIRSGAYNEDK